MADVTLNAEGKNCPLPIILIHKAMRKMSSGQTLEVTATDPAFFPDLHAWIKKKRVHKLLSEDEANGVLRVVIEHG